MMYHRSTYYCTCINSLLVQKEHIMYKVLLQWYHATGRCSRAAVDTWQSFGTLLNRTSCFVSSTTRSPVAVVEYIGYSNTRVFVFVCVWCLCVHLSHGLHVCKGSCASLCLSGRPVDYWTFPAGKVAGPEPQTRHSCSWFGSVCVELLSRGGLSPPFALRFSSLRGSHPAHIAKSTS